MKWWRRSWKAAVREALSRWAALQRYDRGLLRRACVLQDFLSKIILDLGVVAQCFVVCGFQELFAAVAQLLAKGLLHAGITQVTLARGFLRDQLHDHVSVRLMVRGGQ